MSKIIFFFQIVDKYFFSCTVINIEDKSLDLKAEFHNIRMSCSVHGGSEMIRIFKCNEYQYPIRKWELTITEVPKLTTINVSKKCDIITFKGLFARTKTGTMKLFIFLKTVEKVHFTLNVRLKKKVLPLFTENYSFSFSFFFSVFLKRYLTMKAHKITLKNRSNLSLNPL